MTWDDASVIRPIHPFPARMAPDLALSQLSSLDAGAVILDPMAGSGTVLRQASDLGLRAIGYDLDPLSVLMARVWTNRVDLAAVDRLANDVRRQAKDEAYAPAIPWIDRDPATRAFTEYWFGPAQRATLRRIAGALASAERDVDSAVVDVGRIALSRIIITKDQGASLARDVSHSRPHRVATESDFDVVAAYDRSIRYVRHRLSAEVPAGGVDVHLGDARNMAALSAASVDVVLTSPPYLNAIDYMRGHRMALVWLGYRVADLRRIRATSVGTEVGLREAQPQVAEVKGAMVQPGQLAPAPDAMVYRYASDLISLMKEIARVLRGSGEAILVVGNSCLGGSFIRNASGVVEAAAMAGMSITNTIERDLPTRHRYLPMPKATDSPLGKRMRTETILTFKLA